MGRKRTDNLDFPKNLHEKHGGYYYVYSHGKRKIWENLGRNRQVAIDRAKTINLIKKQNKMQLFGLARYVPIEVLEKIMRRDNYECTYCKSKQDLGIDHVVPFSKGGSNEEFNIVVCCFTCNVSKSDKNPIIFYLEKMGLYEKILDKCLDVLRHKEGLLDI